MGKKIKMPLLLAMGMLFFFLMDMVQTLIVF